MFVFSGGTGTPKLLRGIKEVLPPTEVKVVANTGDDIWMTNSLVCPDLDTVLYTLSGLIDDEKWWGIKNDSFETNNFLNNLDHSEFMQIGDKDRAIHLLRTKILKNNSLTEATEIIRKKLGVEIEVFPMTDDEVTTIIRTKKGEDLHFQRWWIKNSDQEIKDVLFKGIEKATPSKEFLKKLKKEEKILIGPSNPITSINPILSLKNVKKLLKNKKVISISPFIGKEVISGPAARLMKVKGYEPSSKGVRNFYSEFLDKIIVDNREENPPNNSIKTNILMKNKRDEKRLAKFLIEEVF